MFFSNFVSNFMNNHIAILLLQTTIEELEQLLMQEKEKFLRVSNEKETTELNLKQEKSFIAQEVCDYAKTS